jgi:hypothetical protein
MFKKVRCQPHQSMQAFPVWAAMPRRHAGRKLHAQIHHRAERTLQEIAQPIRAEHSGQRVEFFIAEVAGNYGDRDGKVAGVLGKTRTYLKIA